MSATSQLSILLVEDDDKARDVLFNVLTVKFPDHRIHTASDGRHGLDSFKLHLPTLVITDVNMPGMDGICLAQEIKAVVADTKLIMLSAYSDKNVRNACAEADVAIDYYISKPVNYDVFFQAIAACLEVTRSNQ